MRFRLGMSLWLLSVLVGWVIPGGQVRAGNSEAPVPARPNILYFYVDDMGWGSTYPMVSAGQISGRFANSGDEVVASDGQRFSIGYTETEVTLTVK